MTSDGKSKYFLELRCVFSGSKALEVKALIDDRSWMLGANHNVYLQSGESSIISKFYPWFFAKHGTIQTVKKVYSKELNNYRDVIYYLPPSYSENTLKNYSNIVIMHDGQNLFDPSTSAFGTAWMVITPLSAIFSFLRFGILQCFNLSVKIH